MKHLAPRTQWLAITLSAAVILSILLLRAFDRGSLPRDIPVVPVIAAVEGDVKTPGIHLMAGPEVTISQGIESAGGLQSGSHITFPGDLLATGIRSGQMVHVVAPGRGPGEIRVAMMPAAVRLTLGEKLEVNTASEEDLMLVPQMKAGFASAIVNHRSEAAWHTLDELEEIPGVGPKTIEKWKPYLEASRQE